MAWSDVGPSDLNVPTSERVAEATYYDPRQRNRQSETEERRRRHYETGKHQSLFDLLFEEVDATPDIDEPVKRKLKRNLGRKLRKQAANEARDDGGGTARERNRPPEPGENRGDSAALEHRLEVVATKAEAESQESDQVLEARRIANQLRYCLAQHTDTSRKVSTYLRALMALTQPHYKPTLVIEV